MDQTLLRKADGSAKAEAHKAPNGRHEKLRWLNQRVIPPGALFAYVCIVALLISFPVTVVAAPPATDSISDQDAAVLSRRQAQPTTPSQCGFDGDSDTYGLGIRIGLYTQWIASSIAYNFVPDEAVVMRGMNNCFQAATFCGLIFVTKTNSDLYAVEAFIMLLFCMGGVCSGNLHVTDSKGRSGVAAKRYSYFDATTVGGFFRLSLNVAFCAYGIWFTFHGMDHMKQSPCSTYAFFFARVNLFHWYRTFLKFTFVMGAITYALTPFIGIAIMIWRLIEFISTLRAGEFEKKKLDPSQFKGGGGANIGFGIGMMMFIMAAELTIRWNHINTVNMIGSTGQLLPMVMGILGLFRVFYRWYIVIQR